MPSFTLPRHWLAQTFALFCMVAVYAAIFGLTYTVWRVDEGGIFTVNEALGFSALVWCWPVAVAPAFLSRKGISPRAFAQQQVLAALAGLAMSAVVALIPTLVVANILDSDTYGLYVWPVFAVIIACIMVPGMKIEFADRAAKLDAT